jgi:hypothetical protein
MAFKMTQMAYCVGLELTLHVYRKEVRSDVQDAKRSAEGSKTDPRASREDVVTPYYHQ